MKPVDIVASEAARLDVDLSGDALRHFDKYLDLLNKWSATTNIVGTGDREELARMHIADCLALVPHLGDAARVVDVGSGAGLPGAVLAIARPALEVTTLEPIHKKNAFVSTVRRELGLANLHPLPERDVVHRERSDFRPYDLATSRAVWSIDEWLERAAALVRPGGRVLAMEGRDQGALPPGARRAPYNLVDRTRAVVLLEV